MSTEARFVKNSEDMEAAYSIRKRVFVDEQGVPAENEYDEHDATANHVLVLYDQVPAATGRWRAVNGVAKLERICVLSSHRSYGLGKAVVEALEQSARGAGLASAKLNGQTHAESFYAKLGYRTVSDIFMEEDIPHVTMIKTFE